MSAIPSAGIVACLYAWNRAWCRGDVEAIVATLAGSEHVVMGGPVNSPPVVGRHNVVAALRRIVPPCGLPEGSRATMVQISAWEDGDFGWSVGDGYLEAPGKEREPVRQVVALVRESTGWKWVAWQLCALRQAAPVPVGGADSKAGQRT